MDSILFECLSNWGYFKRRRPGQAVLVHSDQASQYTSDDYQRTLKKRGMLSSMSRKGNCCKPRKIRGRLEAHVVEGLGQQHSPEQIAGRLTHEHGRLISHECIRQYVERDKHSGGELHKNLRRSRRMSSKASARNP